MADVDRPVHSVSMLALRVAISLHKCSFVARLYSRALTVIATVNELRMTDRSLRGSRRFKFECAPFADSTSGIPQTIYPKPLHGLIVEPILSKLLTARAPIGVAGLAKFDFVINFKAKTLGLQ